VRKNKAVTFDLWATLIKPNPEYSLKRAEFLSSYVKDKSLIKEIPSIIKEIKIKHDDLIENHGVHFASLDLYKNICHALNINWHYAEEIKQKLGTLFVHTHPVLMGGSIEMLQTCKDLKLDVHLISNTVFTDGVFLRRGINQLGILEVFKSLTFSDEVGLSKPNPVIYDLAKKNVIEHAESSDVKILHIGDNRTTDGAARLVEGYKFFERTEANSNDIINTLKQFANV